MLHGVKRISTVRFTTDALLLRNNPTVNRLTRGMAKNSTASKGAAKRARAEERLKQARRKKLVNRSMMALGTLLFAGVIVLAFSSGETATGSTELESWDLPALQGEGRVKLEDFAGKPTVATFFASWCTVCLRELPGFAQLESVIGDQINFVGINTMNNGGGYNFAVDRGIGSWPLARDIGLQDGRQLATNFGARGSPTTVIYDENGSVVDVTLGGMTAEQLAGKLSNLFGVSP